MSYYAWNKINDEEKVSDGIAALLTMIKGAFGKERVVAILRDFVYYPDDSNKETAIVARYPQFFAACKMFRNINDHLKPTGDGKGGTYFGATGCGKTYTMLFLSRLLGLRDRDTFENPTMVIITDREDLDRQTSELFVSSKRYLHDSNFRSIESRQDLQKALGVEFDDSLSMVAETPAQYNVSGAESGGVFLTTIQKFCESTGVLSVRSNIICISDEAHRTQTGVGSKLKRTDKGVFTSFGFAKYLRDSFPNATYCGFTGTPIDETIAVFGDVVDSYTMKESSDDGITVRIAYEPRLARVILSDEQAQEIQKYYDKCADEGSNPEQVEESKKAMSEMQTKGNAPDAEVMNRVVEKMVQDAITCTGIENIINAGKPEDLFSEEFMKELDEVNLPISKFNALLKLLRKAISGYGRINNVKAIEFDKRLRAVVDSYNDRDNLVFTSEVVADFINGLSDELIKILNDLHVDKSSFEKLGISYEEKAFYDILVKVRDDHGFRYDNDKCLVLAKKIKELVDDKAQFADWSTRNDIKNQLNRDLTVLLYKNGYPPEWDEEVFEKVLEQAENFKKYELDTER
jgi:type I site-specific restriction-modification system R (restriction) subunit